MQLELRYVEMTKKGIVITTVLSEYRICTTQQYFHHKKGITYRLIPSFGKDRVLSHHLSHTCSLRSSDFTPYLYWLCGYMKSQVYRDRLTSLEMLRDHISRQFFTVPRDMQYMAALDIVIRLQESDIVNFVEIQQTKWAGYVIRMNEPAPLKKVFNVQPMGKRRKVWLNLRWIDGLDKDLLVLRTRNWRTLAGRRLAWKRLLEKVKA
ncbi:uncharacterized protein TNCV_2407461 [Trichonephila clavipes]|nr:uncharacterized protein TNCV_2407461 [Trichonephila clavipes]